jgi:hypothetical protein
VTDQERNLVKEYAYACRHANDDVNSKEVVLDKFGDKCTQSMARYRNVEYDVLQIGKSSGLPELLEFVNANNDRGCSRCWLSSGGQHFECAAKIKRWFETRETLIKYGESL